MTISVGSEGEVKRYLSSANNRAYNALTDAIGSLDYIEGKLNTKPPTVDFADTGKINVSPVHKFNELEELATARPSDPNYKDEYDVDSVSVAKGVTYSGSPSYINANSLPQVPDPELPDQPGDAPIVNDVVMPDAPILEDIPNPKEYPIDIPSAPLIVVDDFDKEITKYTGMDAPVNSFSWQEDKYTSDLLLETEGVISEMLKGHTGIPDVIWDAIWQREADKENKQAVTLLREVRESSANLNFTTPQGPQLARELEVQVAVYNSNNTRARDISIKQAEHENENLKNAVIQGLAMENMVSALYNDSLNRLLDAAKYLVQSNIELYNSHLSGYKLALEADALEVEIYKVALEAEITKIEIFKSEIMALAEVGKLNQIQVDTYIARHEALKIKVDLYNSQIEAAKTIIETDKIRMEAYGIEIQSFKIAVDAAMSEYEGYRAASQGVATQAQILQANSDLFAKRVASKQSDTAQNVSIAEIKIKQENLELEAIQKNLAKYSADIQKYTAMIEADDKKLALEIQNKSAEYARIGQSDNTILAEFSARVAKHRDENGIRTTNAQLYLDAVKFLDGQYVDIATARAGINSDIGNAAMSAVSVHAGITDSASNSFEVASG